MNKARSNDMMIQNYENSQSKSPYKQSRSEVLSLVSRFVNITRREWIILNEARRLDQLDTTYEYYLGLQSARTPVTEMGPAEKNEAEKKSIAYLNERLAYFYNNGGPIMKI